MNKIYRKVWNATLGQWVVASELADKRRACAAGGVTMRGAGLRALVVLAMMGGTPAVYAQAYCVDSSGNRIAASANEEAVACGGDSSAGRYSVAIGYSSRAQGSSVAVGRNSNANAFAVAVGTLSRAEESFSVAVGYDSQASGQGVGVGYRSQAATSSVAIGFQATATANQSIALGYLSNASHTNSIALGSATTAANQVHIGNRRLSGVATGTATTDAVNLSQLQAVAATANAGWNVAVGGNSANIGPGGTLTFAVGSNLTVTRTGNAPNSQINLAMSSTPTLTSVTTGGTQLNNNGLTTGTGNPSVTINGIDAGGDRITNVAPGTSGTDAVNVNQLNGARTRYYSVNSTGGGNQNNDGATGSNAIAAGMDAQAIGADAVALGRGAQALSVNSVALGSLARASGNAVALGRSTTADGTYAVALGSAAHADAGYSIAVGEGAQVTASSSNSIALGSDAIASHGNSIALGVGSVTTVGIQSNYEAAFLEASQTSVGELAIGRIGGARKITGVAAGSSLTDAVNVEQLQAVYDQFDEQIDANRTRYYSVNSIGGGNEDNDGATGADAIAAGMDAQASGTDAVALGRGAQALSDYSLALGSSAQAGNHAVAIGRVAAAGGAHTVAIGTGADAAGDYGIAVGEGASVGSSSYNSIALGSDSSASHADSVALGALSATTVGAQAGYVAAFLDAPQTSFGEIGIGTGSGGTRKITGVAAGSELTDAVNVAQLQAVSDIADAGWTLTDAGGNAANIGPGGTVTFEGDANLSIAQTGAEDAGVIEVTLNRDLDLDSVTTGDTVIDTSGLTVGDTAVGATGLAITGGPSVTTAGISAGSLAVTDVADGSLPTDAVNVSQLQAVSDVANAGWTLTDADGLDANIGPGGTVTFEGDTNLSVAQTGADDAGVIAVALNRDLDLDSVTTGDTMIDTSGLTVGDTAIDATGVAVGADVFLGATGLVINGGPSVTATGIDAGSLTITSVATGVNGTDAVNVDQMNSAITTAQTRYYSVNSTGGGNENNDGATGSDAIAAGKDASAEGDEAVALGYGAVATGDGGLAFGAGAQALSLNSLAFGAGAVAGHANSIALGAGSATTVGAQSGYTGAYVGASDSTGEMNIGGRQVTGVAAGSADTDAVNVSQLQGGVDHAITESNAYTDAQVADANDAIAGLDSRVTDIEGDITDIQEDISQLDGRMTGVEDSIADLGETATEFDNRLNEIESGADGMFQVNPEGEYAKPQATGTNATAGGNDAVASGDNSMAVGNQSTASGDNSLAMGQGATASHANSVALGQGSATTVGAQTDYEAAYVGPSTSAGEVNVGSRTISGVAPGIAGTDAANINQLDAGVNHAIREANSYTDQRIERIENDMLIGNDRLRRDMNAAVASALAVKSAPWVPGKTTYYAGAAGYRGQGAVGVSLRRTADSGRWSLEGGFTQNRDGSGAYMGVSGVLGD